MNYFDRAVQQEALAKRADQVEDLSIASWGGKGIQNHVRELRKKR